MPVEQGINLVRIDSIEIPERRRKKKGDIEELANNIDRHGLLHPVTLRRKGPDGAVLVAGERRLLAHKHLHRTHVEAKYLDELDPYEAAALEWEENARRLDMDWREDAESVMFYHELRKQRDSEWDMEMTGDCLGLSEKSVSVRVTVAQAVRNNPKKFEGMETLTAAYNVLQRERQRAVDAEAMKFLGGIAQGKTAHEAVSEEGEKSHTPVISTFRPALLDIRNLTFEDYFSMYRSAGKEGYDMDMTRRFNVIHCDFPYGIDLHKSEQGGMGKWGEGEYNDSPELFQLLCHQLRDKLDELMEPTGGHIIFWFPMAQYTEIVEHWADHPRISVNPVPLIWMKSDGAGILPDAQRGPRRIYESALLMSYGNRPIVQAVPNAIAHPASKEKALHPSEKPFVVVQHFLRMLVDETSRVLDPTCGSGTALAAAEHLGAVDVMGVEPNKEHAATARHQLEKVRIAKLVK